MSTNKEPEWIIETDCPNLTVRIPARCEQYLEYKSKEESGALKKLLPHAQRPKAEMLMTPKNYQEMLVVGPGVSPEVSTINKRGDVKTKDPEVAWETWQACVSGNRVPRLHPDSSPIELARKMAEEAATEAAEKAQEKTDRLRKKALGEPVAK